MADTFAAGNDDPEGLAALKSLPARVFPKKGRPSYLPVWAESTRNPKRRLRDVFQSQGVLPRQQVIFISDGGDTVRELPALLHPHAEHILDWFHIAMLLQTARGYRGAAGCEMTKERILQELTRTKWYLWHGNLFQADETLTDLMFEIDGAYRTTTHRVSSTMESGIDAGNVSHAQLLGTLQ